LRKIEPGRIFTINAMALRLTSLAQVKTQNMKSSILTGGQEDIKKKIIRAVGDPNLRFKEDATETNAAIRFATATGIPHR